MNTENQNDSTEAKRVLSPVVLGEQIKAELNAIKSKIDLDAKILYHNQFLSYTGLKIGDVVSCYFSISTGNSKQSYRSSTVTNGIIKQYENGTLYVESIEKLSKSYSTSNNRSGRDYKSWWVFEKENVITDIAYVQ